MSEYEPLIKDLRSMARPESVNSYISYSSKLHAQSADAIQALQERNAELERERDHLKLQAQVHASEKDTQTSTVHEIYQACTGATGEPGSWNGAEPVRKALKDARNAALEEAAKAMDQRMRDLDDAASKTPHSQIILTLGSRAECYENAALHIRSLKGE